MEQQKKKDFPFLPLYFLIFPFLITFLVKSSLINLILIHYFTLI